MDIEIRGRGKPTATCELRGEMLHIRIDDDLHDEVWYEIEIGPDASRWATANFPRLLPSRCILQAVNAHTEDLPAPCWLRILCNDYDRTHVWKDDIDPSATHEMLISCRALADAIELYAILTAPPGPLYLPEAQPAPTIAGYQVGIWNNPERASGRSAGTRCGSHRDGNRAFRAVELRGGRAVMVTLDARGECDRLDRFTARLPRDEA